MDVRHGTHHDAQKSTYSTLPLYAARSTAGAPVSKAFAAGTLGIGCPTSTACTVVATSMAAHNVIHFRKVSPLCRSPIILTLATAPIKAPRRTSEEEPLDALMKLARLIDAMNERIGKAVYWLVLVMVLVSAGNAIIRKTLNMSSNAWLELQWYLFSAVFLLCAAYTLLKNEHVRIDVVAGRLSPRAQAWIDIFGTLFFLLPMSLMIMRLSWPYFVRGYTQNEISGSAGGLSLWPARLLLPVGFALLSLQGLSELIKRIAFLAGRGPDPAAREATKAEEELAAELRKIAEEKA